MRAKITVRRSNVVCPRTTHQSKKIVTVHRGGKHFAKLGDTEQLTNARAFWRFMLAADRPPEPLTGPIAISLKIIWPHTKGCKKADRDKEVWKTTKPDMSNIYKTVEDIAAELGYFVNDSQVCATQLSKYSGPVPGFAMTIVAL